MGIKEEIKQERKKVYHQQDTSGTLTPWTNDIQKCKGSLLQSICENVMNFPKLPYAVFNTALHNKHHVHETGKTVPQVCTQCKTLHTPVSTTHSPVPEIYHTLHVHFVILITFDISFFQTVEMRPQNLNNPKKVTHMKTFPWRHSCLFWRACYPSVYRTGLSPIACSA